MTMVSILRGRTSTNRAQSSSHPYFPFLKCRAFSVSVRMLLSQFLNRYEASCSTNFQKVNGEVYWPRRHTWGTETTYWR